ncbi:MAG: hypothetical protein JNM72_09195 [Deltaproteobacteria bacterium]|nr:hypothetical protein [Deltaproteobacteria bacterium]
MSGLKAEEQEGAGCGPAQDAGAAAVVGGPPLAHRFALGAVELSEANGDNRRTLTIGSGDKVLLREVGLPKEGQAHYVAVRVENGGNDCVLVPATVSAVTIYCAGAKEGAVRVDTTFAGSVSPKPNWVNRQKALLVHTAKGAKLWVFYKVPTTDPVNGLDVRQIDGEVRYTPSCNAGPIAPVDKGGFKLLIGVVGYSGYVGELTVSNGGQDPVSVQIPTEQSPDNFGPQVEFAAEVLLGQ